MEDWLKCQISPLVKYCQNSQPHNRSLGLCDFAAGTGMSDWSQRQELYHSEKRPLNFHMHLCTGQSPNT